MARLLGLLLVVAGLLYPFAVYFGIEYLSPRLFALLLGTLWLARALSQPRQPGSLWMAGAALAFCLLLGLTDAPQLLRWYPVLLNGLLLALFALSLKFGPPVVERLARLSEPQLPDVAVRYTRAVTKVWAGFFLINGLVAMALTLWAPLSWWTLYTGLISYALIGLLFAGEWLLRQRVRRQGALHEMD
ncbi:COG4648 family protein [Pseudomonas borbori]